MVNSWSIYGNSCLKKEYESYFWSNCIYVVWQGVAAGVGHQPLAFQFLAALDVEVRPVAVLASRRDALRQPAIGQLLDSRVNPPEAERLPNHLDIRQRPRHCRLPPVARHPTFPLPPVIFLQPPAQPHPLLECHQVPYLHNHYIKHLHINELANNALTRLHIYKLTHSHIYIFTHCLFFSYFPVAAVTAANIADMWHFGNMAFDCSNPFITQLS